MGAVEGERMRMSHTIYDYMTDEELYLSDVWAEIREDIFERDAYRCRSVTSRRG